MTFWGHLANEIMEPPSYSPAPVLNIFYIYFSNIYIAWGKLVVNSLNKLE